VAHPARARRRRGDVLRPHRGDALMYLFVSGALMFGFLVAGAFFLRAYGRTSDRLFAYFAVSFFILALERVLLAIYNQPETSSPVAYVPRLVAFVLIIIAIAEKNRATR
jgi:hypothetical protein